MKRRKTALLLAVLLVALAAVRGVIADKELEYRRSTEYYQSLRSVGALAARRLCA